ncbi:hypothetical protein DL89DRAFT_267510 [Linderina pennispora]|uniref:Protein kinase domain-containing protein n=1 Tax=Linderina pennispora TaxID=61395 RepID=A0A1Y1WAN3_9FUNG|nr:uncharacterized protein DL89DRAFT_267510 [Linderina pennispora]ORX70296.1 hypothetical protein DL89DRAFT_267510 [Linderina pennispora]
MTTCNNIAELSWTLSAPAASKPAATGIKRKFSSSISSPVSKFSPPKKARSSSNTVCIGTKRSRSNSESDDDDYSAQPPAKKTQKGESARASIYPNGRWVRALDQSSNSWSDKIMAMMRGNTPNMNTQLSQGMEWWNNKDEVLTEADHWAKERLIRDANGVFDSVKSRNTMTSKLADLVSTQVALELERRLSLVTGSAASSVDDIQDTLRELACDITTCQQQQQHTLFDIAAYNKAKDEKRGSTDSALAAFEEWVRPPLATSTDSLDDDDIHTAKKIHESAMSFILFVVQHIDTLIRALDTGPFSRYLESYYQLLPCTRPRPQSSGNTDASEFEAGIKFQHALTGIELLTDFHSKNMVALIEARSGKTRRTVDKAYAQLMQRTRSIYRNQPNRRFAWGLTVCDNEVRVCLFSNDAAFSSSALDMTTAAGRRQFVELLANFALCEKDQLGYDRGILWNPEHKCWTVECPDAAEKSSSPATTKTYYFDKVLLAADGMFGRRTRCYLVTDEKPTGGGITPKFVLKDAWPEAEEDPVHDKRDEVQIMHRITTELAQSDVEDLVYPKLDAGGRVHIDSNGEVFEDSMKRILGPLFSLRMPAGAAIPFRAHKRLAMSPIGESLSTVESVHEFIAVLGDAMRCHSELLNRCNILHRDISSNNILVVREEGKPARGLLIDFDCALDLSGSQGPNLETRGTIPFMSINNLAKSDVERTALDDWESLIYLICWCATKGFAPDSRRSSEELRELPINRWRTGSADDIGDYKKDHLRTLSTISGRITENFHLVKDIDVLQNLAEDLYMDLFQNANLRKDGTCDGSRYRGSELQINRKMGIKRNPFKERLEKKSEITTALLKTMTEAWKSSRSKL